MMNYKILLILLAGLLVYHVDECYCFTIIDNKTTQVDENKQKVGSYENDKVKADCYIDDKFLYINLNTSNNDYKMHTINFGLIVCILKSNNMAKKEAYIEYPIVQIVPPPPPSMDLQEMKYEKEQEMNKIFDKRTSCLLIADKLGVKKKIILEKEKEIYAKINNYQQGMLYELRLPLKMIGLIKVKNFVITINTPKVDFKRLRERYGIPKEDKHNGKMPPNKSRYQPSEIEINDLAIQMNCMY
jgi:hypothetical protein